MALAFHAARMLSGAFRGRFRLSQIVRPLLPTIVFAALALGAPPRIHYEPTIESLNRHPLPQWYAEAKLGIFIHWGLYSVPGWAPLVHPNHDFASTDYISHNPYAEWYLNSMRLEGSPTQAYHREHYGANYDYYNFATAFNAQIKKWNPEKWATIFQQAGAKYVVLTSKHHDGFTLWPSTIPNPSLPADRQHATRDLVGELAAAVGKQDLRMGLYYSGGYDWTFVPGPIRIETDYQSVKLPPTAHTLTHKCANLSLVTILRFSGTTLITQNPATRSKSWPIITTLFPMA